jgi:tRNA-2-methylthio-N6-dimethylallyladenosine synthase
MKKIYLETFGCQMNVLDSELVENQLRALGYHFTPALDQADVVLYNTCSVRERSEQKVWSRLGLLRERKAADPSLVVGVIGCMAERDGVGLMKRMPQVDLMCGPSELDQLPALLDNVLKTGKQQHALAGNTSRRSKTLDAASDVEDGLELLDLSRSFSPTQGRYQAYIRIVRGCNKFCTYCVVPYTRGAEVSRSPQAILDEARKLSDAGCLEITLLGQTVNHYTYEHDTQASTPTGPARRRTTFADLLQLIHDGVPGLPRLRFITSFPADFGDDILHVIAASPRMCRYLHIPAQSGSNRILKAMNRGYTAESYLELVDRARRIVPGIQLAGDFIVGFPTETDDDYARTRDLVAKVRYKNCFIFKYSPRPGTVAIKRFEDDIPEETKRFRNNDLLRLQNRISKELNSELLQQTVEVLCDGPSGWGSGTGAGGGGAGEDADSVIAGARHADADSCHHAPHEGSGAVVLGARLVAGLQKRNASHHAPLPHGSHDRLDRHGQPYRTPAKALSRPGWVQLSGRTTHDQIVVFPGPASLAGKILPIRVLEAHGMTIFGELAAPDYFPESTTAAQPHLVG